MTMRFDFADFSRRFSLNDILRQLPIKSVEQAELDQQKAAYFAQGGAITVCPPPTYAFKKEAPRKPHPEARVKPEEKAKKKALDYSMQAPEGMLSISAAAPLCGLRSTDNKHLNRIREAVELGLLQPDHKRPYGGRDLYYFYPKTITEFYARVGAKWWKEDNKIPTTRISAHVMTKILEMQANGAALVDLAVVTGLSPTAVKRGIRLVKEFGMGVCK